jgi:hypothetical protein
MVISPSAPPGASAQIGRLVICMWIMSRSSGGSSVRTKKPSHNPIYLTLFFPNTTGSIWAGAEGPEGWQVAQAMKADAPC